MFGYLLSGLGTFGIISLVLAIAATVLAFIFVVPERKREQLGAFGKFIHDTCNFKYLIIEKILQALYIFVTAYVILCGFFMLFMAPETWMGDRHWLGGYGILIMIVGPIVVRLVYELLMMMILLVKNVISINSKLRGQNGDNGRDIFAAPDMKEVKESFQEKIAKQAKVAEKPKFCSRCGSPVDVYGRCPNCDVHADNDVHEDN